MSTFLMGVYDRNTDTFRTTTKCGNGHDDSMLEIINRQLEKKV
jgi:ATP-dependent DNA ligase